jgi:hypothetical protein
MVCTICAASAGRGRGRVASAGLLALALFLVSAPGVFAQEQDNIVKKAFKVFGFATDVAPPSDFVVKTRPPSDPNYIPVFAPPPEPSRPLMKGDQLKSVKGDLDAVGKQHDALRQAFPPAAKAMAEQQAAQKRSNSSAPAANQ